VDGAEHSDMLEDVMAVAHVANYDRTWARNQARTRSWTLMRSIGAPMDDGVSGV
jgi:hypothetical protein